MPGTYTISGRGTSRPSRDTRRTLPSRASAVRRVASTWPSQESKLPAPLGSRPIGLAADPAGFTRRGDVAGAQEHTTRALELWRDHGYGACKPHAAPLPERESAAGT